MNTKHGILHKPWAWFAFVAVGSVLVGIWNAQPAPTSAEINSALPSQQVTTSTVEHSDSADNSRVDEIEATLAQAGCPGWMVLASEGESALEPPVPTLVPEDIQPTSRRVPNQVPRIKYPVPLRVASRTRPNSNTAPTAIKVALAQGSPDAPDDLLDGVPDLLLDTSPEPEQTQEIVPEVAPAPFPVDEGLELRPDVVSRIKAQIEALPRIEITPTAQPSTPTEEPIKTPVPTTPPAASPFVPPPESSTPHSIMPVPSTAPDASMGAPAANTGEKKTYCEFIADTLYPSAQACSKCHQKIYDEWSVSSHAYAMVSPMFHKFEQTINDLSQGTSGYFCYRCHSPAGTALGINRAAPIWDLPLVAREGVTCVSCHRITERFGKVNGERRIVPGDIHTPVSGSIGGAGVAEVIARKDHFKVKTSPHDQGPGQDIHTAGVCFDQLSKSEFCVSCHQVAVQPGIKLEVVWEQYRASPACKKGISCQDCHMGRIPGVPSGYEVGAAAKVDDKVVNTHRKHANHAFYGPGYSIAHPGIFPFNPKADRWTMPEWLLFDHRAGWGTDEFEDFVDAGQLRANFPPVWAEVDDRYDAREIIDANQKKLDAKTLCRHQLMENGSHVDGPFFDSQLTRGDNLRFHYVMTNLNEGHNLPTGSLGAQPQLWANVVLINPQGCRIWESGYTDRWGDVADIHSEEVRNKRIPYDWQLFNLQTMFMITGAKGTDREFYLPVNFDFDQLPFLRPGVQPISVINHPPFIRMEGRSLAPLGSRRIPYKVPAHLIQQPGRYRLSFRLRSRTEPIYFMRFVGATREMQRAMNEGIIDFHESSVEFIIR